MLEILSGRKIHINKEVVGLGIFTAMIIASCMYSANLAATMNRSTTYLYCFLLVLVATVFPYTNQEIAFLRKMMTCSGLITVVCVICFGGSLEDGRLTLGASSTFAEDPNYLCGYFIFPIIYYMDGILSKSIKLKQKLGRLILIAILLIIVLLTGSRGGLLSIIGAVGIYYICYMFKMKKSKKQTIKAILIVGIIIGVGMGIVKSLPEELQGRFTTEAVLESKGTGRVDLWMNALKMYAKSSTVRQIFGYGSATITSISVDAIKMWNVAHNFWIETLVELGIIGAATAIIAYGLFLLKAYKDGDLVSVAAFCGFMFMTISLSIYAYKPLLNLLIIILLTKKDEETNIKLFVA